MNLNIFDEFYSLILNLKYIKQTLIYRHQHILNIQ